MASTLPGVGLLSPALVLQSGGTQTGGGGQGPAEDGRNWDAYGAGEANPLTMADLTGLAAAAVIGPALGIPVVGKIINVGAVIVIGAIIIGDLIRPREEVPEDDSSTRFRTRPLQTSETDNTYNDRYYDDDLAQECSDRCHVHCSPYDNTDEFLNCAEECSSECLKTGGAWPPIPW